ncbi:hypothetical protein GCM10027059_34470 [Myceligenerans halotolerans]
MRFRRPLAVFAATAVLAAGFVDVSGSTGAAAATEGSVLAAEAPVASPEIAPPVVRGLSDGYSNPPVDFEAVEIPSFPNVSYIDNGVAPVARSFAKSPANNAKGTGTRPTLIGRTTGLRPSSDGIEWQYTVCPVRASTCSEDTAVARSDWVPGSWKVPAGKLGTNKTYKWTAAARNNPYMGTIFNEEFWFSTGSTLASPESGDFEVRLSSPSPQKILGSLRPTLSMSLAHAVSQDYEYSFEVKRCLDAHCRDTVVVADSGWIASKSWKVPSGALGWNGVYKWTSAARDNPYVGTIGNPSRTFATIVPAAAGKSFGLGAQATRIAGVDLSDQHFEHATTDASLVGAGAPLALARSHSSASERVGAFGAGWSSIFDMALIETSTGKIVRLADGHEVAFGKNANGSFAPAPGSQGMKLESCASPCVGKFTDPNGALYKFNSMGVSSVTNADGFATQFNWNSAAKISMIKDVTSGRSIGVSWVGERVASVRPNGAPRNTPVVWTYTYDGDLLTKVCRPAPEDACIAYDYSGGKLVSVASAGGATTTRVTYSGAKATKVETPDGSYSFAASALSGGGSQVTVTNGADAVDRYELDAQGRTRYLYNSRGGVEQWRYDGAGRTTGYASPQGSYLEMEYDEAGNLTARYQYLEHGESSVTRYAYVGSGAAKGELELKTSPMSTLVFLFKDPTLDDLREYADIEFGYDSAGRVAKIIRGTTAGTRTTERYTYTEGTEPAVGGGTAPAGLRASVSDPAGKVTNFGYTSKGQLATVTDPLGAKNAYSYDWAGRLKSTETSGDGVTTQTQSITYNGAGKIVAVTAGSTTDPITGEAHQARQSYSYDIDGYLISSARRDLSTDTSYVVDYTHDAQGRLLTTKGPDGVVQAQNSYDSLGRLVTTTDAAGATTRLEYTPQGDVARRVAVGHMSAHEQEPHDVVLEEIQYDEAGRPEVVTDRKGVSRRYDYYIDDMLAQVTALDMPAASGSGTEDVREFAANFTRAGDLSALFDNGVVSGVTYDHLRRPVKLTVATGEADSPARQIMRALDPRGLVTSETVTATTPLRTSTYAYDAAGNLMTTTVGSAADDAGARTTALRRDVLGRVVAVVDPRSTDADPIETRYTWDTANRMVEESSYSLEGAYTTKYGYDAFGNLLNWSTPSGATAEATFDGYGRRTSQSVLHEAGQEAARDSWQYNAAGRVEKTTDRAGATTRYGYDSLGQLVEVTRERDDADDHTEMFAYDDFGNTVAYTDPLGVVTTAGYDRRGNLLEQATQVGEQQATWRYAYDVYGNQTGVTSPEGATFEAEYNTLGEVTSATDAAGVIRGFDRDAAGRVVEQTSTDGSTMWTNYDAYGNAVRKSILDSESGDPLRSWNWGYDAAGLQVEQVDPLGGVRGFGYDQRGNTTSIVYEDGATASLGYDADGNVTTYTDPNGNITEASYTATGLLASLVEPSVPGASLPADRTFTWQHDVAGRVVEAIAPGGRTTSTEYFVDGLPATVTATVDAATSTRSFGYDVAGRLTSFSHPDGKQTLTYDELGQLTGSHGPAGNSTVAYDLDGNVTERTDTTGTASFTWEPGGRVGSVTTPDGSLYSYAYDGARLASVSAPSSQETLSWDLLGNLAGQKVVSGTETLVDETYRYDAEGNRLSRSSNQPASRTTDYTYDARHRLTGWADESGTHTLEWDPAGNLISRDGDQRRYDARNQLRSVGDVTYSYSTDGNRVAADNTTYDYDPFGQLARSGSDSYEYDGLGRLSSAGDKTLAYAGLGRDASDIGSSPVVRDPHGRIVEIQGGRGITDPHGDVIAVVDGAAERTVSFDPLGQASSVGADQLGFQNDFTQSGLVNMDARWYDPETGGFLTRDDVALPVDQLNRYAYGMGNPVRHSDPSGHCVGPGIVVLGACVTVGEALFGGLAIGAAAGASVALSQPTYYGSGYGFGTIPDLSQYSYSYPGTSYSPSLSTSTVSQAGAWTWGGGASVGATSAGASSTYRPRSYSFDTDLTSFQASMTGVSASITGLSASMADFNAGMAGFHSHMTGFGTSMVGFSASMTDFDASMASLNETLTQVPQFGIDKPTWAYPDPYINRQAIPVGIAAGGLTTMCGSTSAACQAAIGTAGESCAVPGTSIAGTCGPAAADHLWASTSAAGDAAVGGASAAASSSPNGQCGPTQITTEVGCEEPLEFLERKLDELGEISDQVSGNNPDTGMQGPGWFPYGAHKVPGSWAGPDMTKKLRQTLKKGVPLKEGFVWRAPGNKSSIRIDRGNPDHEFPSQRVDHVVINDRNRTILRDGSPLPGDKSIKDMPDEAHIPLTEWLTWRSWNVP